MPKRFRVVTFWPGMLASDLFSYGGKDYLITIDYHSEFFQVDVLNDTSSPTVINKLKPHVARKGSPDLLIYNSSVFKEFARDGNLTTIPAAMATAKEMGSRSRSEKNEKNPTKVSSVRR